MQEILFQKLKLPILQKTPTGQASTADNVLQELALDFAMPHIIIEYRSLSKLMSTYTSRLVEQINPQTNAFILPIIKPALQLAAFFIRTQFTKHSYPHSRRTTHSPGIYRAERLQTG